jgi:hypothetical protein
MTPQPIDPTTDPVRTDLAKFEPDRLTLKAELDPLFRDFMSEALHAVEACLRDFRVPGSADAKLHASLRGRLLTVGNSKMREIPNITKNYVIQQVYVRELVLRQHVGEPVQIRRNG